VSGNSTRNAANPDERTKAKLEGLGWTVIEVWECQSKPEALRKIADRIRKMPKTG
jgi:G:T-mismatch repair DNA endonuclease (very short patch repair protein)